MKITTEHYNHIRSAIAGIDKQLLADHKQSVKESGKFKDFTGRIMNDCLYFAVGSKWVCDNIYSYADDTHLATVLKNINKDLEIV